MKDGVADCMKGMLVSFDRYGGVSVTTCELIL